MKASWNGKTIAQSDDIIMVENNAYFPIESVRRDFIKESPTHTTCPWKGEASYYHLNVDGRTNEDAAWYYPEPKETSSQLKGRVAFWKGVKISSDSEYIYPAMDFMY